MVITLSPDGEDKNILSLLQKKGVLFSAPCGGQGHCGRCKVVLDGETVLACQTEIEGTVEIIIPDEKKVFRQADEGKLRGNEGVFAVDIGTTTVTVCLTEEGTVVDAVTFDNPQILFGADVLSRIKSAEKGVELLRAPLVGQIKEAVDELCKKHRCPAQKIYLCGNTVMLHLFWGEEVKSLGVYPYTPVFLGRRESTVAEFGQSKVITLPCISSYVGADIVAGITVCGKPAPGKKILYLDLGTNAEIALIGEEITVTSAAAGPCFEAGNISCGMPASEGAVTSFSLQDGKQKITYLGNKPIGLCGSGLIDVIGQLLKNGIIDKTGYLKYENGYPIYNNIILTQKDVREFQTAKSAVRSAVEVLLQVTGTDLSEIEKVCLSGGFSTRIDRENVLLCGLLPAELSQRTVASNNNALMGTVAFTQSEREAEEVIKRARYIDLGGMSLFSEAFIKNMEFLGE